MISVSIMAHPSRRAFVDALLPQLPGAEVVYDTCGDRWDTGRRSLLAHVGTGSDWALTVQDDALLCRNFLPGVERAIKSVPGDHPVSLYIGSVRPHQQTIAPAVREARRTRTPWLVTAGPYWGVAILVPTAHIPEIVEWGDRHPAIRNYDRRIEAFYTARNIDCWYALPSLVDHRPVDENPSLIKGRNGNRRAHYFIGPRSPLAINWRKPPLTPEQARRSDLEHQLAEAQRSVRAIERQLAKLTPRERVNV